MTPFLTLCLFVGIFLGVLVIAKVRDWPTPQLFTRRVKPEDVRISPEMVAQYRRELIVAGALKQKSHVVKADFQRGHTR